MSSFTTILVFLDGYRLPSDVSWMKEDSRVYTFDEWIIIRDYEEFVSYIDTIGVPRVISFGYNLLSKDKTGYNCAEYLIEYCSRYDLMPPVQLCHSTNKI